MKGDQLSARIARLEGVARRDRVLALGALVLLLATAQAPKSATSLVVNDPAGGGATLSATGLAVRDAAAHVRVFVGLDASGYPSLDLSDSAGVMRESMYLFKELPALRFFDPAGKARAEMFLQGDTQNGEFAINDAAAQRRLAVFQGNKGLPELSLYGSDAVARAYLAADDNGPYLVMNDAKGVTRVVAGRYTDGKFALDVRNSAGATAWTRP